MTRYSVFRRLKIVKFSQLLRLNHGEVSSDSDF